jgi:hypothetical protein
MIDPNNPIKSNRSPGANYLGDNSPIDANNYMNANNSIGANNPMSINNPIRPNIPPIGADN